MITFKDFLTEQDVRDYGSFNRIETWAKEVVHYCQPAIKQAGGIEQYSLYRGADESAPLYLRPVRKDRRPRDVSEQKHRLINQWFYHNYGIAYRSNSFAATGNKTTAEAYGDVHLVFPVGNFKFMWSPDLRDIGISLQAYISSAVTQNAEMTYQQAVDSVMSNIDWKTTDFKQAIDSGHEIMITTESFFGVNIDDYEYDIKTIRQALHKAAKGEL